MCVCVCVTQMFAISKRTDPWCYFLLMDKTNTRADAEYVYESAVTSSGGLTEGPTSPFVFFKYLKEWNKQKIDSVALKVF